MKKIYSLLSIFIFALQLLVSIQLKAQCLTPTELSATNITTNGAYLVVNSTNATAQYNIRYHMSGLTTWTFQDHITLPYQLGNLGCNTTYEWSVQQICVNSDGTTSVSDWSAGATFTTALCTAPPPAPCLPPTGLSATNVSQTGAYLYLTPTSTNTGTFNIHYHGGTNTAWTTIENVTLPYQLGGLTCGTTYEWQAQLICAGATSGTTTVSPWSTGGTFTTAACTPPPVCNAPTGLSATNVSQTGAYLYLTPTSTNTGTFNIHYHGGTNTAWTTIENVTLPYQLGGLTCGTTYEWQAQLICAGATSGTTTVSPWSTGGTFTTAACTPPPVCNAPTGLSSTNVSQTGAYLYLTPTSTNTGTFNIHYHGGTNTAWTTIENVTLPYQLGGLTCGTTYEWQAQLICAGATSGTTTVSPWSTGGTFTTAACTPPPVCNAPTGLSATNVSQTGAYLYLTPTSTNTGTFNIHYHGGTNTAWTTIENVTLPYQLGGLTCGTTYEWQVQLICAGATSGTTTVSPWSTSGTFTTLACTPPPTCNAPTGLSATNVSQTGAYLYLTPTSTNTGTFNIHYHGGTNTAWTTIENVTLPYQLGNLTCGTTYEWQAQLICAGATSGTTTVSPWSTGGTFTTAACTPPPVCNAPTGLSATNVSQTGAYLYLTPTSTNTGTFNIHYHGGTNTAWTTIEHVTLPYQLGNLTCGTTYEWQAQLICANSPAGTTLTTLSDWSTGGTFTTAACTPPPTCNAPTGLSATNVSQTGAYLFLTPTSTNTGTFNIHFHGGTNTAWTTIEHVTLPYQLGGLTCGTTYEWQAQLICAGTISGTTTVSPWSTGGTFTTAACTPPPTCNAPTGLSATNVSQTGAYLYLTPTSTNTGTFNIHFHGGTNTAWTTIEHVTLPYQLSGLACGTTYEWQAQLICAGATSGTVTVSPWSTGGTFTTAACTPPPVCNAPTGLSATNVSQTGAYLYLTPTSTNTGTFNIHYHGVNTTTWTTIENVTLPYQLSGLACGTTYEWQAQLICPGTTGTTTVSPWSTGGTFTTAACSTNTGCDAPTGLTATDIHQTNAFLHWNVVNGAVGYIIYYKNSTSASVPFIAVTSSTNSITLTGLAPNNHYIWQVRAVCSNGTTTSPTGALSSLSVFVTPAVLILPNPANQFVNMSFWLDRPSDASVLLRDSYGQTVYSYRHLVQEGANNFEIETASLSSGLYFLSLQTDFYSTTSKIIIAH